MFQPGHTDRYPSPEPDPLFDFFSEQASAPEPIVPTGAACLEKPTKPAQSAEAVVPIEPVEPREDVTANLLHRVERAEQLLDRSLVEIAALKSELATLVITVEDFKKRQARRDTPLPASAHPPASRLQVVPAMIAVVVLAAFATGIWGLMTLGAYEAPEPPAIQAQPAEPVSVPPPVVESPAPPEIDKRTAASLSAGAPARAAPRADPPARAAARVVGYVGTLTIDASPAGEVFLNREPVGHTPLRLERLRAGSHLIWIQREGFRRWTRVVPVTADRVSRVSATLDPLVR